MFLVKVSVDCFLVCVGYKGCYLFVGLEVDICFYNLVILFLKVFFVFELLVCVV